MEYSLEIFSIQSPSSALYFFILQYSIIINRMLRNLLYNAISIFVILGSLKMILFLRYMISLCKDNSCLFLKFCMVFMPQNEAWCL